ncbi:RCC1 domain containing 1 [Caligus rogercresseyi]|uniref:RCC1 domain containing 1 n=1 Tax=Caligus rogercresseyi TaxID=217165 RepID=A0A7T8K733_CALRO|nr:RCC1 domain containing 1 [Caligus rogercresseyi]
MQPEDATIPRGEDVYRKKEGSSSGRDGAMEVTCQRKSRKKKRTASLLVMVAPLHATEKRTLSLFNPLPFL